MIYRAKTFQQCIGRLLATLVCLCGPAQRATADEPKFFCVPIGATGFFWENGRWGQATFNVEDAKYLIAIRTGEENYSVSEVGKEYAQQCRPLDGQVLRCGLIEQWYVNVDKLRYLKTYPAGYWNGNDSNDDTPHIEIGSCSRI